MAGGSKYPDRLNADVTVPVWVQYARRQRGGGGMGGGWGKGTHPLFCNEIYQKPSHNNCAHQEERLALDSPATPLWHLPPATCMSAHLPLHPSLHDNCVSQILLPILQGGHQGREVESPCQGGWHWGVSGKPGDCCPSAEEGAWGRLIPQERCSVSLRAFGRNNQDPMACSWGTGPLLTNSSGGGE